MLRIANASAFWGDQPDAAARVLAALPDLDYLTLDYLAEVSLSIMAAQRERDPEAGYARDFVGVVGSLVPLWRAGSGCRIVTNAGGLNAEGCARAVLATLAAAGLWRMRVAIVTGDDVLHHVRDGAPLTNLETGEPIDGIRPRVATANAYTGAAPIAEALKAGADIVITGRTADPSLTVGPCIVHYDWKPDDWNRIAGATVAGHLIECGTQACGGFSTDWLDVPEPENIGYPVAEISEDGSCVITKPPGTGGKVNVQTVKEQLLYEIGDPGKYLSPDATVSFLTIRVSEEGADRVSVSGATGKPPPESLKVSATYRDGYRAHGMITIFGHDAVRKARRAGEAVIKRLANAGFTYDRHLVECLGTGASVRGLVSRMSDTHLLETVLRISVADPSREAVERFTKEIAPLVTCGPQGVTGYAHGRASVVPVFGYWPTLMPRALVRTSWKFVNGGVA
ncbi:MAG TPA: acyclic terpene utilization AtuA family protein [Opitutaceae bacterium]